jgi:hypothetical protein
MADIVTATLVGRGDVWANVRNAKEEMEICARASRHHDGVNRISNETKKQLVQL